MFTKIKTNIQSLKLNTNTAKVLFAVIFVALVLLWFIFTAGSQKIQFSYSEQTCVNDITYLPNISKRFYNNTGYDIEYRDYVSIGKINLYSQTTCFIATSAPSAKKVSIISALYSILPLKYFSLIVSQPPQLNTNNLLSEEISANQPLILDLGDGDRIFEYQIKVGDKTANCEPVNSNILCDIADLELKQGKDYEIIIMRLFNNEEISTIFKDTITTVSATSITKSSILNNSTVYDKPKSFTFDFSKDIADAVIKLEKISDNNYSPVDIESSINSRRLTVTISDNLDRGANYQFTISNVLATDNSTLDNNYKLKFKTSSGPQISHINIGSYGIATSGTIILTFDQDISSSQDISKYINMTGASSYYVWMSGSQAYIVYSSASLCSDVSISVSSGISNPHGIVQSNSWHYNSRTTCHTTSIIGYSVGRRPIYAYYFGSGSKTILYTGNIHGCELSTKWLMESWIDELERNFSNIPSDKRIVVVPSINPDGAANYSRTNLNGVDLNRNFATSDWQADTYSGPTVLINGGGTSPMSEPETQAIANFTISLMPRLTMSFHSAAGYSIGNLAGDSAYLADVYSQFVGYQNMTGVGGAFSYPITGTYDDWMREKYGLQSVLVELSTNYDSEFNRNKSALWQMAYY